MRLRLEVEFGDDPLYTSGISVNVEFYKIVLYPLQNESLTGNALTQDQSRLSARYFLAASTPFKPSDSGNTSSTVVNWMNQSTFNMASPSSSDKSNERTLVGKEFSDENITSNRLTCFRNIQWKVFIKIADEYFII